MMKKINQRKVFIIVFFILIGNVLFWGIKKEGYYIDELWSYGLSNGYYQPFLQNQENYMEEWHTPGFYHNWLTVQNNPFSFDSVYFNQAEDVHPPFFYFLLHAISSCFQGIFSKWFGLGINLLFFGLTVFLLYRLAVRFLGERQEALIPVLVFGFSVGAVSMTMYIRMYMMLTFFALLFLYLSVCFMEEKSNRTIRHYLKIGLVVFCGGMTQYFFWIFAFFTTGMVLLVKVIQKHWKEAFAYAGAVLSGVVAGMLFFPASVSNMLSGSRTEEISDNVNAGLHVFLQRIHLCMQIVSEDLFFNKYGLYFVLFAMLILGSIYLWIKVIRKHQSIRTLLNSKTLELIVCSLSAICYFLVVSKIATDIQSRYFALVYPILILVIASFFVYFIRLFTEKRLWLWLVTGAYLTASFYLYYDGKVDFVYPGYANVLSRMQEEYGDSSAVYITKGDHLVINNCLFLMQQRYSYPITAENMEKLTEETEHFTDKLIVYVDIYYDEEKTAQKFADMLGYNSVSPLYDNTYTQIFVLERE